jgi:hypothetical protein
MNVQMGLSDAFSWLVDGISVVRQSNFVGIGSGSFYRKIISPKFSNRTPFHRKVCWPNAIWPNTVWPKDHLTETPFDRKFILPKKVIWLKKENIHLIENQFWKNNRDAIWPKGHWPKVLFKKLAAKKLGTHTILMEYKQSVEWKKNFRSNDFSINWHFFRKKLLVK